MLIMALVEPQIYGFRSSNMLSTQDDEKAKKWDEQRASVSSSIAPTLPAYGYTSHDPQIIFGSDIRSTVMLMTPENNRER